MALPRHTAVDVAAPSVAADQAPLFAGHLGLVLTGGTIGSAIDPGRSVTLSLGGTGALSDLTASLATELTVARPVELLSEDITPADWTAIAIACRNLAAQGAKAILVLHGTDTMSYTAAALSFILADLDVPVVMTGSNLPPNHPESDARQNITGATQLAAALDAGVYVAFAGSPDAVVYAHPGSRVRKIATSGVTYDTVGGTPVAYVAEDGVVHHVTPAPERTPVPAATDQATDAVMALALHPGLRLDLIAPGIITGGIRAVVVTLYPSATGPDASAAHSLVAFTAQLAEHGIDVFTVVHAAEALGSKYPSLGALAEAGATHLPGMTPEAATAKAMYLAAQDGDLLAAWMARPVAGELL